MRCPKCKKEHNEWHGNEICFSCKTENMIKKTEHLTKEIEE
jgi:hypothetical protein